MFPKSSLQQICKSHIKQHVTQETLAEYDLSITELANRVAAIVTRNKASNRIERVIKWQNSQTSENNKLTTLTSQLEGKDFIPISYIARVTSTYLQEHTRITALERGQEETWTNVINYLLPRAVYGMQRQHPATKDINNEAIEMVQETCSIICNNFYPFDVPFEAWAIKILNNLILKKFTRSRDFTDRQPEKTTSMDTPYTSDPHNATALYEFIPDTTSTTPFERIEMRDWLLVAINKLRSQSQQQVIILSYFNHVSDSDIAHKLNKSVNAVQILKHRALQKLRAILEEMKDSDNKLH